MKENCSSCGCKIDSEIAQKQTEIAAPSDCLDCIKGLESNPQFTSLLEDIENSLNDINAAIYSDSSTKKKALFAASCINKGHIEGGSMGFHTQFKKYIGLIETIYPED